MGTEHLERSIGDQPGLHDLLAVVDAELGNIYAFILRRCGDRALAEDLTSEVILRAVRETKRARSVVTPAWLKTVARNRLVDHWRSKAREVRRLGLAWSNPDPDEWTDDGTPLEPEVVNQAMRRLPPDHQAVRAREVRLPADAGRGHRRAGRHLRLDPHRALTRRPMG